MKKWISRAVLLLTLLSLVALTACGTQPNTTGDTEQKETKKLVVATDAAFAPFEYMEKGEIVGFDIDLLAEIMKEAGYEYEVKNLGWDPLFAAIQGKEVDLAISGITINDKRKKSYDFSTPYFESTHMILFKEGTDIKSAKDLVGKKVGVQNGTTGQAAAEKILGANHKDISKYENNVVAIMSLKNGNVDAVVTDNTVVNEYLKNNPNDNFKGITDTTNFEAEFYGLMFPKGSELKAKLDAALKTVIENGKYAEIYEKWFGTTPNVETLLNSK